MGSHLLDHLQCRVQGKAGQPTLVYLPGIHGDWTLIPSFRSQVKERVRFVEFSYPRTLTWTLGDYAAAVLAALEAKGIDAGWLLGESFSSQVVWALLEACGATTARQCLPPAAAASDRFRPQGIVLAGGFVRYPLMSLVRLAELTGRRIPAWALASAFRGYAWYARHRHRHASETLANVHEFIRRRLEPSDRRAIQHRLELIRENDPRQIARETRLPVYALAGGLDPVVPALPVRRWLRRHCPGYRGAQLILRADHNVLGTAPQRSAATILEWIAAPA